MHVFITGATGFVGHHLLQALLARGHTARCLVRQGSEHKLGIAATEYTIVSSAQAQHAAGDDASDVDRRSCVEICFGDLDDPDSLVVKGCDAVIHLVGIIDEQPRKGITFERVHVDGTKAIVKRARAAGVRTFIHMSANGARPDDDASRYHRSKWQAEQIVRAAGFDHAVIFRPTIIFGDPGRDRPEFAQRLATTLIGPFPVLPVFGRGDYELAPIHISNVVAAFVDALTLAPKEKPVQVYCLGGPENIPYVVVLDRIAQAMGISPKPKLHLPMWFSKLLVGSAGSLGLLPISPAQFKMLIEGNVCSDEAFVEVFGSNRRAFTPENLQHLRRQEG